jgi:iron complex outermembrane receptor protein
VNRIERALLSGASALALCAALSSAAFGQTSTAPAAKSSDGIETVVVTGIRGSLRDALKMKATSDLITDDISSKDIGQLPDITIAEELNTLPGLDATRDRGNDSQINVRGLGPRMVLGLVDGQEIASSEPDQNIRWEIFPSEIVSGVQVYKTQAADLIAGGIAGTINIMTVSPLDYTGPEFTMRAGPTYNEEANTMPNYSPWGGRGSVAWVDHVTNNFAFALDATFQREKSGYNSFQGWGYNLADAGNAPILAPSGCSSTVTCTSGVSTSVPWGAQTEVTEITQDRSSLLGNFQWRPDNAWEFKFNNMFAHYNITENQFQQWYGNNGTWGAYDDYYPPYNPYNSAGSSYVTAPGANGPDVVAANLVDQYASVTNNIAHYNEDHTIFLSTLDGKWTNGTWIASDTASFSLADRLNRWRDIETEVYPPTMTFDTAAGVTPTVTTPGYDPSDPTNQPMPNYRPGESAGPEHTHDQIMSDQIDFTRAFDHNFFTDVDFGARFSDRTKDHSLYQWYVCPGTGVTSASGSGSVCTGSASLPANELSQFTVKGFTVPQILYGNFEQLAPQAYGAAEWGTPPPGALQLGESWRVHEEDWEGYAKAEFSQDIGSVPMSGDLGVRLVNVQTTSSGFESTGGPFTPISVGKSYTDVLPSLNMNFHLAEDQTLRFGVAEAISRPPLDELRTGYSLNPTGKPPTGSGGNPLLNPYKDVQVDLSYEWYWHDESLLAVAPFYKHLDSFIGYNVAPQTINGVVYQMTEPVNGKGGDIDGVELTGQSRFYFLPGVLQDFGIYSNYSFVNSQIHEFTPSHAPFEATGLARNTADASLWYSKDGFEARISLKYHSKYTEIYGWDAQTLYGLAPETTLDFSTTYQWNENIGLRFEAHNLTNEVSRAYWNNDPNEIARYDIFGRSYLVDITYRD